MTAQTVNHEHSQIVLSGDAAMDRVSTLYNMNIMETMPGPYTLCGTVVFVKRFSNVVFARIAGTHPVSIACPRYTKVREGDFITATGTLTVQTTKLRESVYAGLLEVTLKPTTVHVEPKDSGDSELLRSIKKTAKSFVGLESFLQTNDINQLLIAGTQKAITDVTSVSYRARVKAQTRDTVVADKRQLLNLIKNIDKTTTNGVAFVRGGADESLEVWDDLEVVHALLSLRIPYYLALGHADTRTLACKYADDSFPTASDLGNKIESLSERLEYVADLERKLDDTTVKLNESENKRVALESKNETLAATSKLLASLQETIDSQEKTMHEQASAIKGLEGRQTESSAVSVITKTTLALLFAAAVVTLSQIPL